MRKLLAVALLSVAGCTLTPSSEDQATFQRAYNQALANDSRACQAALALPLERRMDYVRGYATREYGEREGSGYDRAIDRCEGYFAGFAAPH